MSSDFIISYVFFYWTTADQINKYAVPYISIVIGILLILVWVVAFKISRVEIPLNNHNRSFVP